MEGRFIRAELCGSGHINDTFFVECKPRRKIRRYVLQRINHFVFKSPETVISNMVMVTGHIAGKIDATPNADTRECIRMVPTTTGAWFHRDDGGNYWRCLHFIERSYNRDNAESPADAAEAGRIFARFQSFLSDLPAGKLGETIPRFHHTPTRFINFSDALAKDAHNRAAICRETIDWALSKEPMTTVISSGLDSGALPVRVTHNDTKFNNVLFCEDTDRAICVTDLDTVMPGSILYDFGDQIRTTTSHAAEDEPDTSKISIDLDMFEGLTRGYLSEAIGFLTPEEIRLLVFSGRLITYQIGLRFLTDYLEGDVYFKTHRPRQNLDRARAQFALARSMENHGDAMEKIVEEAVQMTHATATHNPAPV
ncbi:phosphotransferase [Oscillatoria amoena NRMC-F 0135]|nr:phosphotransferase [Oscillatoria amoena NRMC-F 0135]